VREAIKLANRYAKATRRRWEGSGELRRLRPAEAGPEASSETALRTRGLAKRLAQPRSGEGDGFLSLRRYIWQGRSRCSGLRAWGRTLACGRIRPKTAA